MKPAAPKGTRLRRSFALSEPAAQLQADGHRVLVSELERSLSTRDAFVSEVSYV